jgi:RNA polymerase sigma-70 factor (ECF subfamily)
MFVDSAHMSPARAADPVGVADTPTFDAVYDEHFAFVWRSARRLGVSEAAVDDVVQEIFLVVHRRLDDFEARSSLKTWLFGIALRVVRDHRRSLRRKAPHSLRPEAPVDPDALRATAATGPHEAAARAEAVRVLHELLDALDDDKREVFVLAELEQMSAPEIADALGTNVNTVYSRLRVARQAFDEALARHHARDGWRMR